jgi:hypothetical protein
MREFPPNGESVMLPGQATAAEMPPVENSDQPGLPLEDPDPRPPEERPLP